MFAQHTSKEEKNMFIANIIAFIIAFVGCLNWGLVGIFGFNLVTAIFGATIMTTIIYILVLVSILWLVVSLIMNHGRLYLTREY